MQQLRSFSLADVLALPASRQSPLFAAVSCALLLPAREAKMAQYPDALVPQWRLDQLTQLVTALCSGWAAPMAGPAGEGGPAVEQRLTAARGPAKCLCAVLEALSDEHRAVKVRRAHSLTTAETADARARALRHALRVRPLTTIRLSLDFPSPPARPRSTLSCSPSRRSYCRRCRRCFPPRSPSPARPSRASPSYSSCYSRSSPPSVRPAGYATHAPAWPRTHLLTCLIICCDEWPTLL